MRKLQEGEDMPLNFWNYNVNPIVGYHVPKMDDHSLEMERKYNVTTQSI